MNLQAAETSAALPCHQCGYDLRAHPPDGQCPECNAPVAESRRLAAIPQRPAWRDSDPRWRRRTLAGVWLLVLLPLMQLLQTFEWASNIPVPTVINHGVIVHTLDDTLVTNPGLYEPLMYCMGVVLLFSKERGRRGGRLDWTRRWGIFSTYVVLLLSAVEFLFFCALVLAGVAASFQYLPLKHQPEITPSFVKISAAWLRYGPNPSEKSYLVLIAFSSVTMLLASTPLWAALRSSGPRLFAPILLAPLAFLSIMHLQRTARFGLGLPSVTSADVYPYEVFFSPRLLLGGLPGAPAGFWSPTTTSAEFAIEATKWCTILLIAVWLSIAQLAARRSGKRANK